MAATRKKKPKKDTSFATWKFELENTVNADPQTDGACLQVVRAYLDFMGDAHDRPFMSISNLKVATALHEGAIVRARRKLIDLGYFVQAGYTSAGAVRFQILNSRRNLVLDHQTIARETWRRLDAEKKERERAKRKTSSDGSAEIAGDMGPADIAGLNGKRVCGNRRDRSAVIADESVKNSVEVISNEEERGSYSSLPSNLIPPSDPTEARLWVHRICTDRTRLAEVLGLMAEGKLTPSIIREISA